MNPLAFGKNTRSPRPGRRFWRPDLLRLEDRLTPAAVMHPLSHVMQPPILPAPGGGLTPLGPLGTPGYEPDQIRQAYGINAIPKFGGTVTADGAGQTIAITDAYDDPTIAGDLAVFDKTFGTAANGLNAQPVSSFFTKVGQTGGAVPPPAPPDIFGSWATEISLDVEWAHAVAPAAKILLVEATDPSDVNLYAAVVWAASQPGVTVVSNSWGGDESPTDTQANQSTFVTPTGHPGVTFVASAGDSGVISYPASSPNVLAIGGTNLQLNSDNSYAGETGWTYDSVFGDGGGGGLSQFESRPGYQDGVSKVVGTVRGTPDVAYNGDPATSVSIYDTYDFPADPWQGINGTSAGSPQWAGLLALVNQGRAAAGQSSYDGVALTLNNIYALPAADFHDITQGQNGYGDQAGPGYDLLTGLGSPVADKLVPDLVGYSKTAVAVTTPNPAAFSPVTLKATVTGPMVAPTGTVDFKFGAVDLGQAPVSKGVATFTTSALPAGNDTITATYLGDATYAKSSGATTFRVGTATTTVLAVGTPAPTYGDAEALTATVTGADGKTPTGSVDFKLGGIDLGTAPMTAGVAELTTTALPAGKDAVTATYLGDSNYVPSTGGTTVTVARAPLAVKADDQSRMYGSPNPVFTVTATGFVNGETAGKALTGAPTTAATPTSPLGQYPITQGTLAAANYAITFTPGTLTVTDPVPTATLVNSGPVAEGGTAVVRFVNQAYPIPAGVAAGFHYSYAFTAGAGAWDVGDGTYAGSVSTDTAAIPAALLADGPAVFTVRARIIDVYGGHSDYTTTVTVVNAPPTATLVAGPVPLGTATTLTLTNPTDPSPVDVAAGFTYSFDFHNDGTFTGPGDVANSSSPTASYAFPGPGVYRVRARITDKDGGFTDYTALVGVTDVNPTATFTADPTAVEGGTATLQFTNPSYPLPDAAAAGFRYSFDFDGNGSWDLGNGTYAGSVTTPTVTVPAAYLADGPGVRTVRARILDVNGGYTDYSATIAITNAPPTATLVGGTFPIGRAAVVQFTGATDPSPVDRAAGFTYSFDFTGSGDFTTPGNVAGSSSPTAAHAFPAAGTYTVRGRITDKDGGFTEYTTTVTVTNVPPTATLTVSPTTVNEGQPFTMQLTQAFHPSAASMAAGLRYSFDFNGDGAWDVGDGTYAGSVTSPTATVPAAALPAGPGVTTVRARVIEVNGAYTDYTAQLTVLNVPPTATLVGPTGAVAAATPVTFQFTNVKDASSAALAAGLTYSFDFTGSGDFTTPGNVSNSSSPTATYAFPRPGQYTVRAQVADVNGGSTAYTTTVTVTPYGTGPLPPGVKWTAVGADAGGLPTAELIDQTGAVQFSRAVFDTTFTGGVRVAAGDVNGDGVPDLVVGSGPGMPTLVKVYDGKTGTLLGQITPFEAAFTGGVFVTVGDVTGDGKADVIVTPDEGGGPRVRIFSGDGFGQIADFYGIRDTAFRGGARATVGDVNGDGTPDLVVAAGFGGGPRVAIWDGRTLTSATPQPLINDFYVFEQGLRNGVYVAAGDLNGDGFADLVFGGGPGGGPRVFALSGKDLLAGNQVPLANFFAGDTSSRGGVRVSTTNVDGDNKADLVVGPGAGDGGTVSIYYGKDLTPTGTPPVGREQDAFPGFSGGVFVG